MFHKQSTEKELSLIEEAGSYEELAAIAITQLQRMKLSATVPIGIVCGPISTGGAGSIEANIARFSAAVDTFKQMRNGIFFSQIEYEEAIWRLKAESAKIIGDKDAGQELLDDFYLVIFESGFIDEMDFLPDWQTSNGARWERSQGERLGVAINDITEFYDELENVN